MDTDLTSVRDLALINYIILSFPDSLEYSWGVLVPLLVDLEGSSRPYLLRRRSSSPAESVPSLAVAFFSFGPVVVQ